jgi:hypothetical protein
LKGRTEGEAQPSHRSSEELRETWGPWPSLQDLKDLSFPLPLLLPHQIKALIVENTFTCVEDMVPQLLPPLGALIGRGKPLNFLVTNKWSNELALPKVTQLPLLMLISGRVSEWKAPHAFHSPFGHLRKEFLAIGKMKA